MQRRYRLRKQADFQRVRREGRSWAHPLAVVWVCPNGLEYSRVGFSAGRALGNAVVRNRAKRRLREAIRHEQARIAPGWDIILGGRAPLAQAGWDEVVRAVRQLLTRASLYEVPVEDRQQ